MATVRKFEHVQRISKHNHTEVDATISLVEVGDEMFIQIDTFGSANREMPSKLSQTLRLSKSAYEEIVGIGKLLP